MKHKKSVILVCACMILLALIGSAWHLNSRPGDSFGWIKWMVLSLSEDTAYGPGYSERAFRKVAIGDTEAQVREVLGAPLDEREDNPGYK